MQSGCLWSLAWEFFLFFSLVCGPQLLEAIGHCDWIGVAKKMLEAACRQATYRLAHLPNQIAYKGLHHKACMAFTTQPKKKACTIQPTQPCNTKPKTGLQHKVRSFHKETAMVALLKPFNNKTLSWLPTFPSSQKAFGTAIYQTLHTAGWQYNKQCQTSLSGMPTGVICKHYFASRPAPKGSCFCSSNFQRLNIYVCKASYLGLTANYLAEIRKVNIS